MKNRHTKAARGRRIRIGSALACSGLITALLAGSAPTAYASVPRPAAAIASTKTTAALGADSILANGGFEEGASGWGPGNGTSGFDYSTYVDQATAQSGIGFMASRTALPGQSLAQIVQGSFAPGEYVAHIWVRSSIPEAVSGRVVVWATSSAGTDKGEASYAAGASWTPLTVGVSVTATRSALKFELYEDTTGITYFYDTASISLAPPPPLPPPPSAPEPVRDRLGPGEMLAPGQMLASPDGRHVLMMQSADGNLVLRAPGNVATWSSGTSGHPGSVLMVQPEDGNLVIRAPGNVPVWESGSAGNPGSVLIMQNDGRAVLYAPGNRAIFTAPPPPPPPPPLPSPPRVRLCADKGLRGNCSAFDTDDSWLNDDLIGNDRASSISVPPGSHAAVFLHADHRGSCNDYGPGTYDIGASVGDNEASSIWVGRRCPSPKGATPRVKVCVNNNLRGDCSEFSVDDAWLGDDLVGNDRASSLLIPPGGQAAIFLHADYRGTCTEYGPGTYNISAPVGNDEASSIWIGRSCPVGPAPRPFPLGGEGLWLTPGPHDSEPIPCMRVDKAKTKLYICWRTRVGNFVVASGVVADAREPEYGGCRFDGADARCRWYRYDVSVTKVEDSSEYLAIGYAGVAKVLADTVTTGQCALFVYEFVHGNPDANPADCAEMPTVGPPGGAWVS